MKGAFRRIGALILVLCLLTSMMSVAVLAEDGSLSTENSAAAPTDNASLPDSNDGMSNNTTDNTTNTDTPTVDTTTSSGGNASVPVLFSGSNNALDTTLDIAYSASGYSDAYDGASHSITVSVSTAGATVLYAGPSDAGYGSTNPSFTEPGEYTVRYQITAEGYTPVEGSETVKITEAEIDYKVTYLELEYDGQAHAAGLNVRTDGVTISYSMQESGSYSTNEPTFTNPGRYMVYFRLEKHGYTTETGSAELVIRAIDISDAVEAALPSSFVYTGEPVHFDLPTDKIKEWSVKYWLGDGDLPGPPSDPDDQYFLIASGESDVYCAHIVHKFSIIEYADEIEYTVSDYSGTYDGKAHTIALNVSTEGVSATYATSQDGEYSATLPSFTEPGAYTVWFRLEKENYATVTGSASVTIMELGRIEYTVSDYSGYYDGAAHTIDLVAAEGVSATYATSRDGAYSATLPSFTEPGAYTVWFKLEKENYATVTGSASVTIMELGRIEYTVSDYSGYYDGAAHTIDLVAAEGVSATYATSQDGEYTADKPSFTEPGAYTVWFRLEKEGYETVIDSASVTIAELGRIEYTVSSYSGYYDGAAHTIDLVAAEGVSATYATSQDGEYTADKPSFTEPGEYTVWFKLEKAGYETVTGSATVTIAELGKIEYTVSDYRGYYDGAAHTISLNVITEGVNVSYATYDGVYQETPIRYTDVGFYTVWFRLEKEGYETVIDFAEVNIAKPGTILYTVERYYDYYDGAAHTIPLNVITEGVDVTYSVSGVESKTPPTFTDPGEYNVWFTLKKEGYKTVIDFATVTIMELRQIEYSVEDNYVYCDGGVYSILLRVTTAGVSATYATSEGGAYSADMPVFTDVGAYTVWFRLEKEGYETVTGSATVAIGEPSTILYTLTSYEGAYDGQPHTISLNVLTEDVTVTYFVSGVGSKTPPAFTEPGFHHVTFRLEKEGYTTKEDTNGYVNITPGIIEYSARGYSGYADGKAHSISLYVSTPDAKVSYATSQDGEYSAAKPSFSRVGTHTVWYRIEKEHYETVEGSEVVKLRQPKEDSIVYSVEDYVGAYDGEAHTIALDVTTPDIKASYATTESGAYGATLPTFTEPGTYTVWFKLEKSGFETVTGSATVTIEKAEQTLYFNQTVIPLEIEKNSTSHYLNWSGLIHERGDGALSWSSSDPGRILVTGNILSGDLYFKVPYEEWSKGYSATITVTAAETDHYKAATATCKFVFSGSVQGSYTQSGGGSMSDTKGWNDIYADKKSQNQETLLSTNLDLTIRPVTNLDNERLSGVSNELRKKLMASAGSDQIGAMAVDAALTDNQTGEELHSTTGDLTLSPTGSLSQSYQQNYKNMACVAVHLKQNSTDSSTVGNSKYDTSTAVSPKDVRLYHSSSYSGGTTGTDASSPTATSSPTPTPTATPSPTAAPVATAAPMYVNRGITTFGSLKIGEGLYDTGNSSKGGVLDFTVSANEVNKELLGTDNSNEEQLLVSALGDLTLVPTGSLSPTVEFIPCKLTESGVVIKDTSLSPFLLIYGPKEAFSKLLTVRAKDGVFTYDGEGHAVAAEPSIEDGTSLYYSLDLENWQTDAPAFTDVNWNEDGSVGSYQVYVLAENPDCDPAVCGYSVTIVPAA